jgi:hypothetical protein
MINKKTITVAILFGLVAISLFFSFQHSALALRYKETNWTDTDMSMTELLNGGWKVTNHSTNRAFTFNVAGGFVWDTETYTFMLNKENKYILCFLTDPKPPQAKTSGCRGLN